MFFIMGISQKEKKLSFDQLSVCKCCGRYGHIEVFMTYTYLMFFFIPLFKWNIRYYVKISCCGAVSEISKDMGRAIERGEITSINIEELNFNGGDGDIKRCHYCGYVTNEDFKYCPKCGKPI